MSVNLGFPGSTSSKEPICQHRRLKSHGFNPWVRRMPWRRACNPLQCSHPENPKDTGAWRAPVHRVTKSWTRLTWLSPYACSSVWQLPQYLVTMQSGIYFMSNTCTLSIAVASMSFFVKTEVSTPRNDRSETNMIMSCWWKSKLV